ncbi:MAG: SGNH/GDSL hydrolase family protein [Acidobacteria bacterium]|nr:SGNH/GDSL hydrolase family protein [Acidobacteriota bacterium]
MKRLLLILVAWVLLVFAPGVSGQSARAGAHWVGTWATSPVGRSATPAPAPTTAAATSATGRGNAPAPPLVPNNQTLREIVHTTIGGDAVRVVLANTFGTGPLSVGAASVALRESGSSVVTVTSRTVTFGGKPSTTIPAGAVMMSDPVTLTVPAFADLAIDVFLPNDMSTMPVTVHSGAYQTSYASAGNHAGEHEVPAATTTTSWYYLSRVEVRTAAPTSAIVTLGDSITDGTGSTVDANSRWPDQLARRLAAQSGGVKTAVLNAGIAGNRLLSESTPNFGINILARFDRDVLALPGATHVVVMEGINDIGAARENPSPGAADLIAAHRQLIERAHARGLKIIGATLTPFEGAAYFTAVGETKRQAINDWIRTGKAYDGVIDFDAAVRDPQQPTKFLPQYENRDHLHPNDAGYQAMGRAIDLALFR